MLQAWEIVFGVLLTLAILFPLRQRLSKYRLTITGILIGALVGRLFYIFIVAFFGFDSTLIKLLIMGVFAYLFVGVARDFRKWIKEDEKRD